MKKHEIAKKMESPRSKEIRERNEASRKHGAKHLNKWLNIPHTERKQTSALSKKEQKEKIEMLASRVNKK